MAEQPEPSELLLGIVKRLNEPIPINAVQANRFYWVRLIFPTIINETTPVDDEESELQIFKVENLDKRQKNGLQYRTSI